MFEFERLVASDLLRPLEGLFLGAADNPELVVVGLLLLALNVDEVRGNTVAPPELARNAPVLDVLKPAVPLVLGLLGLNEDFAFASALPYS